MRLLDDWGDGLHVGGGDESAEGAVLSVEFLLSCEATLEERLHKTEAEYIDAHDQATTYRML